MRRRRNLRRRSSHAPSTCHVAHQFWLQAAALLRPPKKRPSLGGSTKAPDDSDREIEEEECTCDESPTSEAGCEGSCVDAQVFFEIAISLPAGAIPLHSLDQHRNHAVMLVMLQCIPQQVKTLADLPARSQEPVATLIFASESEQPALAWCCGRGWL